MFLVRQTKKHDWFGTLFNNLEISDVLSGSTLIQVLCLLVDSIKCRICTCHMTAVRLAQPDRVAKDSYAQKVYEEFVSRPISNDFRVRTH